ncbi:MAG: beta-lactamase family protein [Chloroflexi bacterium]|nr:beta-lactamase family protein [Chloroflexota bacterium]
MRRLTLSLAAVVLLSSIVLSRSTADFDPFRAEILADAESLALVGGAVVIVDRGESRVWTFGTSDAERRIPVDPDTLFSTGSIAKPLIAFWLDQQQFDTSITLNALWPDLEIGQAGLVTVAQAIDQTSGFPRDDSAWVGRTVDPEGAAAILRQYTPVAPAGERFTYNSVVFALAARGAARDLGMAIPWMPDGERPATPFELALAGDLAAIESFDHGVMSAAVDARVNATQLEALLPDLIAWANDDGSVRLGGDAPERSCCPLGRSLRYANGWFVEQFEGYDVFSHLGSAIGGTAVVMVVPELALGVAVLVNQDHSEAFVHATRYKIVLRALGRDTRAADVLVRRAQAQRAAWAALAAELGVEGEPIGYGALTWPTATVPGSDRCRIVLRGPLLGQYIGTDCTKP